MTTATTWALDTTHSEIGFRVRHMMVSWTRGRFGAFAGEVVLDDANPERNRVEVSIEAASVDTRLEARDQHLRSADFLDVEHHPRITFRSTSVRPAGEDRLTVHGELTIRGVTRPVELEVDGLGPARADPWGGLRRGAQARARIDRRDFGLVWNGALEAGGVLVGDEVRLELEVELIRTTEATEQAA